MLPSFTVLFTSIRITVDGKEQEYESCTNKNNFSKKKPITVDKIIKIVLV